MHEADPGRSALDADRVHLPGRADLLGRRAALDAPRRPRRDGDARPARRVRPPRVRARVLEGDLPDRRQRRPDRSSSRPPTGSPTSRRARATSSTTSGSTPRTTGSTTQFLRLGPAPRPRRGVVRRRNARALPPADRAEQFPRDPRGRLHQHRASAGSTWRRSPGTRSNAAARAALPAALLPDADGREGASSTSSEQGWIRVYAEARARALTTRSARDVATGRGLDYSLRLRHRPVRRRRSSPSSTRRSTPTSTPSSSTSSGRWYNNARLAVEMGGGYGEPVIISLRDGRKGRPHYPKLYRHTIADRPDARHARRTTASRSTTRRGRRSSTSSSRRSASGRCPGLPRETDDGVPHVRARRSTLPSPARAGRRATTTG